MDIAMIDDRMLPADELAGAYLDRGLYFGDGVYEVVRSYNGRIFALDDHLERFERSLHKVQIVDMDTDFVRGRVLEAFEQAGYANAKIYFHITRGSGVRNHLPGPDTVPNFLLTVSQLHDDPKGKQTGIAVCSQPDWRWKRCDIKSLNLLANVLARIEARKTGASEAILVGDDGLITEGAASAFFAIDGKERAVITRPLGHEILPSITRKMVMQVARNAGLSVVEKPLTPNQAECDELFIAVTTQDIVPVVRYDDSTIGDGQCGSWTRRLVDEFQSLIMDQ
ncbi:MAG: aminotransferase class IV [Planctomycetota bacterium]|jgi:D-alanine transaminase